MYRIVFELDNSSMVDPAVLYKQSSQVRQLAGWHDSEFCSDVAEPVECG